MRTSTTRDVEDTNTSRQLDKDLAIIVYIINVFVFKLI